MDWIFEKTWSSSEFAYFLCNALQLTDSYDTDEKHAKVIIDEKQVAHSSTETDEKELSLEDEPAMLLS